MESTTAPRAVCAHVPHVLRALFVFFFYFLATFINSSFDGGENYSSISRFHLACFRTGSNLSNEGYTQHRQDMESVGKDLCFIHKQNKKHGKNRNINYMCGAIKRKY